MFGTEIARANYRRKIAGIVYPELIRQNISQNAIQTSIVMLGRWSSLDGKIKLEIFLLSTIPNRYPLTFEESRRSEGIHKMPVENFLVCYWINETQKTVWGIVVV